MAGNGRSARSGALSSNSSAPSQPIRRAAGRARYERRSSRWPTALRYLSTAEFSPAHAGRDPNKRRRAQILPWSALMSANWPKTWLLEIAIEVCTANSGPVRLVTADRTGTVRDTARRRHGQVGPLSKASSGSGTEGRTIHFDYTVTTGKPTMRSRRRNRIGARGRRIFRLTCTKIRRFAANRQYQVAWTGTGLPNLRV